MSNIGDDHHLHPEGALGRRLGRPSPAALFPQRHRCGVRRQPDRPCRSGLRAARSTATIDGAGFCVMPGMVNVHTHLQSESIGPRPDRGARQPGALPDRHPRREVGVRDLGPHRGGGRRGGPAQGQQGLDPECHRRAAQERLHHGHRSRGRLGRLARHRSPTPASAPWPRRCIATRAGSCRPAIASTTSGTPRRAGATLPPRWRPSMRAQPSVGPAQRHAGADAGRHLHARADPRQHRRRARARHQDHRALLAAHPGVPGDGAPAWRDAGAVDAPGTDCSGRTCCSATRSSSTTIRWCNGGRKRDLDLLRRDRHLGGALPGRVLALRPDDGGCRQLHPQGRERGDRHRHRAAEHGGGGAHGLDPGPRRRQEACAASGCRSCSMPPRSAARRRSAATISAGSASAPRPTSCCSTSRRPACGRCAIRCAASSSRAADRAVRHVFVDGQQVVKDFEVTTIDHAGHVARAAGRAGSLRPQRALCRLPRPHRRRDLADQLPDRRAQLEARYPHRCSFSLSPPGERRWGQTRSLMREETESLSLPGGLDRR